MELFPFSCAYAYAYVTRLTHIFLMLMFMLVLMLQYVKVGTSSKQEIFLKRCSGRSLLEYIFP